MRAVVVVLGDFWRSARMPYPGGSAATVAAIAAGAFLLRVVPGFRYVFTPGGVNLQDGDAWYHLRLIEYQVRNFPGRLLVDPYLGDGGAIVAIGPLFDFVIALVAWLTGLGAPSDRHIAVTAAVVPPAMAALAVVVVFLLGGHVFGRLAGLIGAAVAATMPGHFLDRTRLGFVDHHAAEVLLALLTLYLLMRATASGDRAGVAGADAPRPPRGLVILAGLAWGAYLVTWTSGAMLSFIVAGWVVAHTVVARVLQGRVTTVPRVVAVAAVVAMAVLMVVEPIGAWRYGPRLMSLVAACAVGAGLHIGIHLVLPMEGRGPSRVAVAVGVVAMGAAVVGLLVAEFGEVASLLATDFRRLSPGVAARTVGEVTPLFLLSGTPNLRPAWDLFRTAFFIGGFALLPLAWRVARRSDAGATLIFVFGVAMATATVGQNRFGYYLAPVLATLTGWMCAVVFARAGVGATDGISESAAPDRPGRGRRWRADLTVAAVAAVVFVPNVAPALATTARDTGLSAAWRDALDWLRLRTPEPFGGAAAYAAPRARFEDPRRPAYTVMVWWDYSYPVVRIGRRVPVSAGTQAGAGPASWFFSATDPEEAHRLMTGFRSRYVMVSEDLLMLPSAVGSTRLQGKFAGMVAWGRGSLPRYYEIFLERDGSGRLQEVILFHPDYYRSMAARLFLYGGRAEEPRDATWVITHRPAVAADGKPGKEIVASRVFATFAEADRYLGQLGAGPHAIVGRDPMRSCVPIEALSAFNLIYDADDALARPARRPSVRLFEYRAER